MVAPDPAEFAAFEFAGWQRVAGQYETTWAGLTRQFIPALLDAAAVTAADRVLDVACGPGYVAAAASARGATVTGVDFSPRMVDLARAANPRIEFLVGDAQALAFEARSFDVVVMNFGLLHLSEPGRALSEARRVLRPDGRFAFTVWVDPSGSPGARLVDDAIRAHANLDVPLPQGPDRYGVGSLDDARDALSAAGFAPGTVAVHQVTVGWSMPSPEFLFLAERDAGVRTAGLLAAQSAATRDAIRRAIADGMREFRSAAGYVVPYAANVIAAGV